MLSRTAFVSALLVLASQASAEGLVIYPAKGQTAAQQSKDEGECQIWAKQNTGIDPLALASKAAEPPPVAAAPTAPAESGQRLKGAARGAAGGAVVGAIAGDAGKGAAIGATAGAVRGRRGSKQAAAAQQADAANSVDRAFAACMEGRGYTVK